MAARATVESWAALILQAQNKQTGQNGYQTDKKNTKMVSTNTNVFLTSGGGSKSVKNKLTSETCSSCYLLSEWITVKYYILLGRVYYVLKIGMIALIR